MMTVSAGCLSDEQAAAYVHRDLDEAAVAAADAHMDACAACRWLVSALGRGSHLATIAGHGGAQPGGADGAALDGDATRYELGDVIARGGQGRIRVARDRRLGRVVAIKEIVERGPAARARLEREAAITARLQHPAIVSIYDAGRDPDGAAFYAMPRLGGRSLDEAIAQAGSLAARIALVPRIAAVIDAVAYAHSEGIVHRDLKPANVLVGEFGETVVIDWGLACEAADPDDPDGAAAAREIAGTPGYMAPEQTRGAAPSRAADVYALGAMLYHVLAGAPPYRDAGGPAAAIAATLEGPPRPLAEAAPGAPPELVAIAAKAMARAPADRYRSAREMAGDLDQFLTGKLVAAHAYSPRELLARWLRRHRAAVATAAVLAAALLVTAIVAVRGIRRQRAVAEARAREAETERRAAEQLLDFQLNDLHQRLKEVGRLDLLAEVGKGFERYDATTRHRRLTGADIALRCDALLIAADVHEARNELADAERAATRCRDLAGALRDRGDPAAGYPLGMAEERLGDLARRRGDVAAAEAAYRAAQAAFATLDDAHPKKAREAALVWHKLAYAARDRGDPAAMLDGATRYRDGIAALLVRKPDNFQLRDDLAQAHTDRGAAYRALGRTAESLAAYQAAAVELRRLAADRDAAADRHKLAGTLLEIAEDADPAAAAAAHAEALPILEALVARDPSNRTWETTLSYAYDLAGGLAQDRGDLAAARASFAQGVALARRMAARAPGDGKLQRELAISIHNAARVAETPLAAAAAEREALAIIEPLVAAAPDNAKWTADLALFAGSLGRDLLRAGDRAAARAPLERARDVLAGLRARGALPPNRQPLVDAVDAALADLGAR